MQGVADSFLPVLAPPAVVDSSSFLSEEVVQQSVKAPSEWGPLLAGICLERPGGKTLSTPVLICARTGTPSEPAPCPCNYQ